MENCESGSPFFMVVKFVAFFYLAKPIFIDH